jgi:hypothetical protein
MNCVAVKQGTMKYKQANREEGFVGVTSDKIVL